MPRMTFSSVILMFLFVTGPLQSKTQSFEELIEPPLAQYQNENFQSAFNTLELIKKKNADGMTAKEKGKLFYLLGILGNRIQRFDLSIDYFKNALELGFLEKDLYYEYGQALYAGERLQLARKMFILSAKSSHKVAVSLYYFGHLSQRLKENRLAVAAFKKIEGVQDPEKQDVLQAARLQVAEIFQSLSEEKKLKQQQKNFQKIILPYFKRALDFDKSSLLAREIDSRMAELNLRYGFSFDKMANGRPLLKKRHFLRFSQEVYYDSNVIFQPEGIGQPNQSSASLVGQTQAFGRYTYYPSRRISLAPELRLSYLHHFDRSNDEIFQNDMFRYDPSVRTSFEHKLFSAPASFLVDFEFTSTFRDYNATKELDQFSTSKGIMLGERFRWTD